MALGMALGIAAGRHGANWKVRDSMNSARHSLAPRGVVSVGLVVEKPQTVS